MCGDGFRDPGEQCDDGNTTSGDGCSATCVLEACGNNVIDSGEQCDDGVGNGTDNCCSSLCQLVDPDGDGVCSRDDRCPADTDNDSDHDGYCVGTAFQAPAIGGDDPCSRIGGAGEWSKPKAIITKLDPPPGDEKLTLKGAFQIPTGGPTLAPQSHGVHLRIMGPTGQIVLEEHVPGGFYTAAVPTGWKLAGDPPTKFTYIDKTVPPARNGIKKIVITDKSAKVPGLIAVTVNGDHGNYPLPIGDAPITVSLELNDTGTPQGSMPGTDQCGEAHFKLAPLAPTCTPGATKITCK